MVGATYLNDARSEKGRSMKLITRNGSIWTIWLATVLVSALILAWVSVRAMQSERDEARLAVQFENERLALWRMESRLLPMISRESAWNSSSGVLGPSTVQSGHLLLTMHSGGFRWRDEQEFVSCRFHVNKFRQIFHPTDVQWQAADSITGLSDSQRQLGERLRGAGNALFARFDRNESGESPPFPGTLPTPPTVTMGEYLPEDPFLPDDPFLHQGRGQGQQEANTPGARVAQVETRNRPAPQMSAPQFADPNVQMSRNAAEFGQRSLAANSGNTLSINGFNSPASMFLPMAEDALISFWLEDSLLLARPVSYPTGPQGLHGCVLDWNEIQRTLCSDVRDLLPNATLVAIANDEAPSNLSLASIPVRLEPGELPTITLPFWSPMRVSLLVAWLGFLICAIAVGGLLLGLTRLSQRRADFVSAVSHELRTPLTTFQIYTDLLSDTDSLTEEKRERYLATLKREAGRLTGLVDNVLGFSRLESTSLVTQLEPMEWSTFRESIAGSLTDRASQAGMTVRFSSQNITKPLLANQSAMERILINLVDNACKYAAGSEPPTIDIVASGVGDGVEVHVADNGPGLSDMARRRLFKPFSKSATEAAQSAHGVGLGLSLSRELARSMRGDLTLEKSDDTGTTFVIRLNV